MALAALLNTDKLVSPTAFIPHARSITPAPFYDIDIKRDSDFLVLVKKRGGGGVYTGTLATGPPSPIYAKHTTVNGSRPGFIVICILAGLIFFTILGGGYWWYRRRRRLASGVARRYSSSNRGGGGIFGAARKSMSGMKGGAHTGEGAGAWSTLDGEEDAFDMAPSTNVSMMDLNDQANRPHHGHGSAGLGLEAGYGIGRKWNPVYAASGESLNFTDTTLPTLDKGRHEQHDEEEYDDDADARFQSK
jgi:hypothetical protein